MWSYIKFQTARRVRRWRREVRAVRAWAADYFDRHVWGKWRQLGIIRRLVVVWWGSMVLMCFGLFGQIQALGSYYHIQQSLPGGQYAEGLVGKVKLVNPILSDSSASADASRLVFNGLTRITPRRTIEGDLATSWAVSSDGRTYTFNLRHGVKWHDSVPFTARDVAFTITAIQNPDTRSPLAASWLGVKAEAKDDYTVVFTLPNPYSPFIYSTTVGILPSHILESTDPSSLRISNFNQKPIGTGPFKLTALIASQGEIQFDANPDYYGGKPKIDQFTLRLYDNYSQVLDAYAKRQLTAVGRYLPNDSASKKKLVGLKLNSLNLPDESDVFLRTTSPLLGDKAVRQALAKATDRSQIISQDLGTAAVPLYSPILPGQIGYAAGYRQSGYDLAAAQQLLDDAGWAKGVDGLRAKDGQTLKLKLVTSSDGDYPKVAGTLKNQWAKLGVGLDITTVDVKNLQQTYIKPRNYDALLFGINIGADPDEYVYWHSSQATDPGLNLSQYNSATADKALESGRIASDADVRTGKYHTFLAAWMDDTPAIVLYQPNYIYAASSSVRGIPTAARLVDPADRFYKVEQWTVRTRTVNRGDL